ncbi:type I polyketide synthase [Actinoplanes sp. LDG1-06]|uniref:Type I polyketide synthase n=1 Tax=Paractinoplanes ovalisporus TaxID=2810368 RepID=A0ABS2AKJ9_9ACTN|nr:type I polyketide synthase [Actinoplanes ovalisporus]MBM2620372.1 type I polyketide synthase [Actinoplanes ovalisporus]
MSDVAIIGMAGRLPGAPDLGTYWANLRAGLDRITRADAGALRGIVDDRLLDDPRWIGASGTIAGACDFDPAFFGMAPKDALVTDPQHRLLLTVVHEALEDACLPAGALPTTGVFAGVGRSRHEELVRGVLAARGEEPNELVLEIGNEKDHAATKTAFRLGLGGPAVTVQTACSTGLLAVHQAARSLAGYETDIAIAAAAAVRMPHVHGYLYLPGGIGSPDGVCRPFSARAGGAVAGDGAVGLVLKRLADAEADGDRIYAVIRGSAANNDGAKTGYASVSADAQERVLRDALLFAELEAEMIGAVEAHGSGTPLGDATEWSALSAVFGKSPSTVVGSVKSSLGHLREASGLAGLVRAVFSVRHGRIPPTLNVGVPADFVRRGDTGLRLARRDEEWTATGPRRAGVSAFGLGGTNVHVIVEQPPDRPVPSPTSERAHVVLISAGSAAAADRTAQAWSRTLRSSEVPAVDAARASQLGRRHRRYRRVAVGGTAATLAEHLAGNAAALESGAGAVGFVFPGVGDQYPGMGQGLRDAVPGFADLLDANLDTCSSLVGRDLRPLLEPVREAEPVVAGGGVDLRRLLSRPDPGGAGVYDPVASHAVLMSVQLAIARSMERLGVRPAAVTGHSLGELAAATVAGVFDDRDALRVVVRRAQLVAAQPEGAMLATNLPAERVTDLLGEGVWVAAVNSPRSTVLAGERDAVRAVAEKLSGRGLESRLMPIRHAYHTPLLRAAGDELAELLGGMSLRPPAVPMVENVTGDWAGDVTSPRYWSRQLTTPVQFGRALRTVAQRCDVLLEIGPGQLLTLASQARADLGGCPVVPTVRRNYQTVADDAVFAGALGAVWQAGGAPDWTALGGRERAAAVSLPPTATDVRRIFVADGVAPAAAPMPVLPGTVPEVPKAAPPPPDTADEDGDGLQAQLAQVWTLVLGVDDLNGRDDFFALGGDSLMSVQLILGIEDQLGVHVPAVAVFEESTLAGMTRRVRQWQIDLGGKS